MTSCKLSHRPELAHLLMTIVSHDVALPTECDDEFWDHPDPEKAWKQAPGVPCKVAYFNSYMKQNQILAHILYLLVRAHHLKICTAGILTLRAVLHWEAKAHVRSPRSRGVGA